jgi:hypothetical protein
MKPDNLHRIFSAAALLCILALSACAPASAPAPTQTVSAIYTAAAQTFTAQQAAQATGTPSAAPSPSTGSGGVPVTGGTAAPGSPDGSGNTNGAGSSGGVPVTGGGATAPGGAAGSQCNNSAYVNDVTIPDGSVILAGAPFTKTWTIMNTGTCSWTTDYRLTFFNGESMGGTSVALTTPVPAGAQTQVSVNLTAPVLAGNYTGSWQMVDPQGNRFGEVVTVVITVSATGGASITATP